MKEQIKKMAKIILDGEIARNAGFLDCSEFPTDVVVALGMQRLAGAKALYNEGYRKQEWISVDDRLPDTDEVLVYYRKGVGHAAPKKQGLDKMDWDVFFNITGTTHWMPLPQPPKMKGGAE